MCDFTKNYYIYTSCLDPGTHFFRTSIDGSRGFPVSKMRKQKRSGGHLFFVFLDESTSERQREAQLRLTLRRDETPMEIKGGRLSPGRLFAV
ncbi:hypothetical protein GGS20DRAFT_585239 [Poronia punctata]|nr:hypothetical protein GGS20DRAFT_585239 [Poronia punctata]